MTFIHNLEQFARFCPLQVKRVQEADLSRIGFCTTEKNEQNLCINAEEHPAFYHHHQGAIDEAKQLFEQYPPLGIDIQFIFGLGLGYFYEAWQPWLQEDSERLLIFLEDDPAVLHRFLETERAAELLANPQLIIMGFHTPDEKQWGRFRKEFEWFFWACAMRTVGFLALPYYREKRFTLFEQIANQIQMNLIDCNWSVSKYIFFHKLFVNNWFHNVPWLADSGYAPNMYGFFNNVPVIICGAGPSLTKQIPLLRSLQDKALIIGSGTAVNILNKQGIFPHVGLALDPYEVQESRFLTNYAWETPYFYANQFYGGAFSQLHAEKAFLLEESLNQIHEKEWLIESLELANTPPISRGISTSNIAFYLAEALGCNPIVFVGLDLAYTKSSRYAEGAAGHPTDDRAVQDSYQHVVEKLLSVKGVDGLEVLTKWDWVLEADCFSDFAVKHPDRKILNATEGGWPIDKIANVSLKEVEETYFQNQIDIQGMVHAAFQNSRLSSLTTEKVEKALKKWKDSLDKALALCSAVLQKMGPLRQESESGGFVQTSNDPSIDALKKDLESEIVYPYCLKQRNAIFKKLYLREMRRIQCFPELYPDKQKSIIINEIEQHRYRFLKESIEIQLHALQEGLSLHDRYVEKMKGPVELEKDEMAAPHPPSKETTDHHSGKKVEEFYENGQRKSVRFLKGNKLDGKICYYSSEGALLSESQYTDGSKEGTSCLYYKPGVASSSRGALYAELPYRNNTPHGKHVYYYPDGKVKSLLTFSEGVLEGSVELYYPNGQKKRILHFQNGKLNGKEQKWDEAGTLVLEADYCQNLPCGKAMQWYPNGQIAKEILFYDNPQNYDVYEWDMRGNLVQKKLYLPENPLREVLSKSEELQKNINALTNRLNQIQKEVENKKDEHG